MRPASGCVPVHALPFVGLLPLTSALSVAHVTGSPLGIGTHCCANSLGFEIDDEKRMIANHEHLQEIEQPKMVYP